MGAAPAACLEGCARGRWAQRRRQACWHPRRSCQHAVTGRHNAGSSLQSWLHPPVGRRRGVQARLHLTGHVADGDAPQAGVVHVLQAAIASRLVLLRSNSASRQCSCACRCKPRAQVQTVGTQAATHPFDHT